MLFPSFSSRIDDAASVRPVIEAPAEPEGLRRALDQATPGTTIVVAPGAYVLPDPITISDLHIRVNRALPLARIDASAPLPVVRAPLQIASGVRDVRLTGIKVTSAPEVDTAVWVGTSEETTIDALPSGIVLDRCIVKALGEGHRGIMASSGAFALTRSRVYGFVQAGRDSQAFCAWNGPGPYVLIDNVLEGSGENVLLGGAFPAIPGCRPSLVFQRNHCRKPLAWKAIPGSVKNLFELKNCAAALIEHNLFENCWPDAQAGHGIVLTAREDYLSNILFRRNTVRGVEGYAINILGRNEPPYDSPILSHDLTIEDNTFEAADGIQIIGWDGLTIRRNRFVGIKGRFLSFDGEKVRRFSFTDNETDAGEYGIVAPSVAPGTASLDAWIDGPYEFVRNVIRATWPIPFPAGNTVMTSDVVPMGTLR